MHKTSIGQDLKPWISSEAVDDDVRYMNTESLIFLGQTLRESSQSKFRAT